MLLIVIYQRLIFEQDEPFNFANMCQIANWLTAIFAKKQADGRRQSITFQSIVYVVCCVP